MKAIFSEWRAWRALGLLVALTLFGTVFTACSDDEESEIHYVAGIDETFITEAGGLLQLQAVEKAYLDALNVSDASFTLTGSVEECDAQVLQACQQAEAVVEAMDLEGVSFVYTVKNVNTSRTVYSYTSGE